MAKRVLLAALCAYTLVACDAQPSGNQASKPGPPTDGLTATFHWAGSLALNAPLQPGDAPPQDADCAAAYEWAVKKHHAEPFEFTRVTIEVTTQRVVQINESWLSVRTVGSQQTPGWDYVFECSADHPEYNPNGYETFDLGGESCTKPMECRTEFQVNSTQAGITLAPGDSRTRELTLSKSGVDDVDIVIDFDAKVNGVHVSRALNTDNKPFIIHDWPWKQGLQPATYTWTPGSDGSRGALTFTPGT